MAAAANGIWHVLSSTSNVHTILLQVDCLHAIEVLKGKVPPSDLFEADVKVRIELWLKFRSVKLRFKHVKGHNGEGDRVTKEGKRTRVQWWCDQTARTHMKEARFFSPG